MGTGLNSRFQYSPGVASSVAPNGDPLISIGGGSPFGIVSNLSQARESEIYNDTSFDVDVVNPYEAVLAQALAGSTIFAEAGDWLLVGEQNAGDEPSFSAADDARGSIAKILTAAGPSSETDNSSSTLTITLDRPLSGLPVAGDSVRVSKRANVFADVTADQARDGLVDHSELWYWNSEILSEDLQFWIDRIQPNGCRIELMRPGEFRGVISMNNVLALATDTPFTTHDRVLLETTVFDLSGAPRDLASQVAARGNGALPSGANSGVFRAPFWLRRTVPPGTNPGEASFALRVTSEQLTSGTPLAVFDQLNCGAMLVFKIAAPASRVSVSVPDRLLYAGGGARVVTTLVDQDSEPLQNRSLVITATQGTITPDPSIFTDENGQITNLYEAPPGSGGLTETFTAVLSRDPLE